jgi:sulfate permease, SulP family
MTPSSAWYRGWQACTTSTTTRRRARSRDWWSTGYDAPLFFANAQDFRRRALAAAGQCAGPARWFVLNVEANVEVDYTALEAVDAVRDELSRHGIIFALARVKQDLLDDLQAFGLAQKTGAQRIFPTLPTAVAAYQEWAKQHPQPGPGVAA